MYLTISFSILKMTSVPRIMLTYCEAQNTSICPQNDCVCPQMSMHLSQQPGVTFIITHQTFTKIACLKMIQCDNNNKYICPHNDSLGPHSEAVCPHIDLVRSSQRFCVIITMTCCDIYNDFVFPHSDIFCDSQWLCTHTQRLVCTQ